MAVLCIQVAKVLSRSRSRSRSRSCTTLLLALLLLAVVTCCSASGAMRVINRLNVREEDPNGTVVTQLTGRDLDLINSRIAIPANAKLQVTSPSSELFTITRNGQLVTATRLDREAICSSAGYATRMESGEMCYVDVQILLLVAGESPQMIIIPVLIMDINNKAPSWLEPTLSISVPEEVANFQLKLPTAIDRDSAPNGVKRYRFVRRTSNAFDLLTTGGGAKDQQLFLKVTQRLDREKQSTFNFTIEATDGSRSGYLDVFVTVADSNDNTPSFSKSSYNFSVSERSTVDTQIAVLHAVDPDAGANGQVVYSMADVPDRCTGLFNVDSVTGKLSVARTLDHEKVTECVFVIQASDNGELERRSNTTIVNITIVDANDNAPQIEVYRNDGEKQLAVSENATIGTIIGHVCPSDADSNGQQRVECDSLTPHFSLQPAKCYLLRLARQIDREAYETSKAMVTIRCTDLGFEEMHEVLFNFTVLIEDINDNAPRFETSVYQFRVMEGEPISRNFGRVVALDLDANNNSEVTYFITKNAFVVLPNTVSTSRYPAFQISVNGGELSATTQLDREVAESYTIEVLAIDRGVPRLNSTATVVITVVDRNDNSPVFQPADSYRFSVIEHPLLQTSVGHVFAADRDAGANGKVRYALSPRDQAFFRIDDRGHIFTVSDQLDREGSQGNDYYLTVFATDSADSPDLRLTATATVAVTILDKNDNKPVFTSGRNATFLVDLRHSNVGDLIGKVEATDEDDTRNGNGVVRYYHHRNSSMFFEVDGQSGDVRIARALSAAGIYSMVIRAEDGGQPPLYELISINIIVVGHQQYATESSKRMTAETLHNILLVGTLSAVAAILSVILIITIYFLRRHDRNGDGDKRRQGLASRRRRAANRQSAKADIAIEADEFGDKRTAVLSPQPHEALIRSPQMNPIVVYSPVDCSTSRRTLVLSSPLTRAVPPWSPDTNGATQFKSVLEQADSDESPTTHCSSNKRSASFAALHSKDMITSTDSTYYCVSEKEDSTRDGRRSKKVAVHTKAPDSKTLSPRSEENLKAPEGEQSNVSSPWFARCTLRTQDVTGDCGASQVQSTREVDSRKESDAEHDNEKDAIGRAQASALEKQAKVQTAAISNSQGLARPNYGPDTNFSATTSLKRWIGSHNAAETSNNHSNGRCDTSLLVRLRDQSASDGTHKASGTTVGKASCSGNGNGTLSGSVLRKKQIRFANDGSVNSNYNTASHSTESTSIAIPKYTNADGEEGNIGFRIC